MERVVTVVMDARSSHGQLVAALDPVADRLLKRFKAASAALAGALDIGDARTEKEARDELSALILFKSDLGAFLRVYAFLSQMFDYGTTAVEKRAIFFKRLLPLLEFGREREGVDLSKVILTHHKLKDQGRRSLALTEGEADKLKPLTETGGGEVHDKDKVLLDEIIEKVNTLFEGDLTDGDKLSAVNTLGSKMLESAVLVQQAANNTKQQFSNSPDLTNALMNALMDSNTAHNIIFRQALESDKVRQGLLEVLLGPAQLYEALRSKGEGPQPTA